jgi:ATP-binding cassette, subfamily B, multidrug efflux pump
MHLIHIVKKSASLVLIFFLLEILGSLAGALEPLYLQKFMSAAVSSFEGFAPAMMANLFLMLAVLYILASLAQGLSSYIMTLVSSKILRDIRNAFFAKISSLPIAYFRNVSQGEFVTKFTMDVSFAERFLSQSVPQLLFNLLVAFAILIILMVKCNRLLILLGLSVPLISSLLVIWLNSLMARYAEAQRESYADINRVFDETVQGIDAIKIFSGEDIQKERFGRHNELFRRLTIESGRIASLFSPFISLTMKGGNLIILILIYFMIMGKSLDRDGFLLFFFYLILFQSSINTILGICSSLQPTLTSLRRLDALFSENEEDRRPADGPDEEAPAEVSLELRGLSFSYPGGRTIFRNASLLLEKRHSVLIMGPSGSGKTTLINLLLRFFEPQGGRILINGRDLSCHSLSFLRGAMSVVTQDHFIFEESLRENITLGSHGATDGDVMDALRGANLQEWCGTLPQGLDTILGSRGKSISGGERQRICIARALFKKPPLIILDEPFANVDHTTRDEIVKVLSSLKKEKTLLIISHQPIDGDIIDERYVINPGEMSFRRF